MEIYGEIQDLDKLGGPMAMVVSMAGFVVLVLRRYDTNQSNQIATLKEEKAALTKKLEEKEAEIRELLRGREKHDS